MCLQDTVFGRVLESDQGGGPAIPGTRTEELRDAIEHLSDGELKSRISELVIAQRRGDAAMGLLIAEMDQRQVCEREDRLSTAGWLRYNTRMSASEASGSVKTARAMAAMPTVTEHALAGEIPSRSTQLLSQARDRHGEAFADHEEVFGEVATYLSVRDLRRAIGHWEQQIDFPGALAEAEDLARLRAVYLSQTTGGLGNLDGTLTPEGYATIKAAVDAHSDPFNLDSEDKRTLAQRRADVLVDIHRFWLDHNTTAKTSAGEKPHIAVTVDFRQLTGELKRLPEMAGVAVSPEIIRQLTCDSSIIPVVLGSESEPLDIGRKTRTIPAALRRAVELRDRCCTWRGCGAPPSWCDIHHITHWADGGTTSLANCRLLCRKHHTSTHQLDSGQTPDCAVRIAPQRSRTPPDT